MGQDAAHLQFLFASFQQVYNRIRLKLDPRFASTGYVLQEEALNDR
jgi:hypothetical protein